jgi:hypothetical protein
MIASVLDVTRFTIYNYLNEIGEAQNADQAGDASATDLPTDRLKRKRTPL